MRAGCRPARKNNEVWRKICKQDVCGLFWDRLLGCKAGVALSPSVPLGIIEYYLPLLDKVTIMIVEPGISGQPVDPQMYVKISCLAQMRKEKGLHFLIEADGSMNRNLYLPLYQAGADMVVLGPPALWNKAENFETAWSMMEEELAAELQNAQREVNG